MRVLDAASRLLLDRWPVFFVVPAFVSAGYTWAQVLGLTVLAIVLTELVFAIVKVLLLTRE